MLILTRKIGEVVNIGKNQDIKVILLGINGGQVKLGFEAPIDVLILREEVPKRETEHEKL